MIYGPIKSVNLATARDARLEAGFAFLDAVSFALAEGRHEISGGAFALVSAYQTASPDGKKFEAHRKYIDLQYLMAGEEIVHVADVSRLVVAEEYDDARDVAFFNDPASYESIVLRAGLFAVFYPDDAHRPGMMADGSPSTVKKVVVKIPLGL